MRLWRTHEEFDVVPSTDQERWVRRCAVLAAAPPLPGAPCPAEVTRVQAWWRGGLDRRRIARRRAAIIRGRWCALCRGQSIRVAVSLLRDAFWARRAQLSEVERRATAAAVRKIQRAFRAYAADATSRPTGYYWREILRLRAESARQAEQLSYFRKKKARHGQKPY